MHSENKHDLMCDFEGCTKGFSTKSMLRDHKNTHLGLKPYVCQYCGDAFSFKVILARHKYRHTNPEKYKCKICGECYISQVSVDRHVERKHNDDGNDARPFACDFEGCTSTFKYEDLLKKHKNAVHLKKRKRTDRRGERRRRKEEGLKIKWRLQHDIEKMRAESENNLEFYE